MTDDYMKEYMALRRAELARGKALAAATEALVEAALAWASAAATEWESVDDALRDAVAAYRNAKGEG